MTVTALSESPSARALGILATNQRMIDVVAGNATRQLFEPKGLFALGETMFARPAPLFTPPRSPIADLGSSLAGQLALQRASSYSLHTAPLRSLFTPSAGVAALLAGRPFAPPALTAFAGLVPRMTFASPAQTSVAAMFAGTAFTTPKFSPLAASFASVVPSTALAPLFSNLDGQHKLFAEAAGLASYRRVSELVASQLSWQRNLSRLFEPSPFWKQFEGVRQPSWEEIYGVALAAFTAEAQASARLTPRQRADIALVLAEVFSFALDSKLAPATRGQVAFVLFLAHYFLVSSGLLSRD